MRFYFIQNFCMKPQYNVIFALRLTPPAYLEEHNAF